MYATGTDSLPETSGVAGTVAIPTRFVWPHGGRRVFLSGSFTRWSEHVPMSPVEGCPTVFQAICSLTPGYHEYKFFVDGEWRHDEHQPSVMGNYGTVNTVLLTREPNPDTVILCPETPGSRSNMDVDNDAFYRMVTLSAGTLEKVVPRFSETDLEVSRHRISAFLSAHEAFELLPESGKIITLDVDVPVKQAFHILYEQGIPIAPLWDFCKGQVVGVLTPLDFILILRESHQRPTQLSRSKEPSFLSESLTLESLPPCHSSGNPNRSEVSWGSFLYSLNANARLVQIGKKQSGRLLKILFSGRKLTAIQLGKHGSNLTEEELETHTIAAWKEVKLHLTQHVDGRGQGPRHLVHAGPFDSLKDVAFKILQNKVSTIPIIQRGSYPELLHLASLSGILKCICRHFRHSSSALPILQQPICSIPLGTWVPRVGESNGRPLAMLRPNSSLNSALSLLVQAQVSSIPVVDENDSLVDIYSRSDITALAKGRAYAQIHLDGMSIQQALQLGQDPNSPYSSFNVQRCQMCLPSDPLHKVMERLAIPGVRQLVIVEAGSKRVEGIISLSDVFRLLLS